MTKEEKDLLFKDLCMRLPYHVRCKIWLKDGTIEEGQLDLEHNYGDVLRDTFYYNKIIDIKPYLRPMSSMTDEEINILCSFTYGIEQVHLETGIEYCTNVLDWLNAHHFDYRGLIERGLALEALDGMYN